MNTLIIRHVNHDVPAQFQMLRPSDGKFTPDSRPITSPVGFPVEGRPGSDLMRELRWYLESFLGYPFPPETEHSERVLSALRAWGEQAFNALFNDAAGGELLAGARKDGDDRLHLQLSSDDPRVLAWPWEALHDPRTGNLAQTCQIERRLNAIRDPIAGKSKYPNDRVNILLVTARPMREDVRYRSVSRPLVELIESQDLPAKVTVLRPPTFDTLRAHLASIRATTTSSTSTATAHMTPRPPAAGTRSRVRTAG